MKCLASILLLMTSSAMAQYVGSKACYGCHTSIYKSYQKTSMGRSLTLAEDWKPGTLPMEGEAGRFSVSHDETGWFQTEAEPGVYLVKHPLSYVVGSGTNGLTFLIHQGEYLLQAPLSYYSKARQWSLSPGYETSDLGFTRVVSEECLSCHAGRSAPASAGSVAYANPPFHELAIGCENCHGPGEAHVQSAGKLQASIVNPAKLTPRLAENICMNCHQAGDGRVLQPGKRYQDFRPGQWLFDTFVIFKQPARTNQQRQQDLLEHHSAMQASRCFIASQGKLGCLTCHDPHVEPQPPQSVGYYRAKCLTCHTQQSCSVPLKARLSQSPADDCVACHMPKRPAQQISHSALTNHRIPARPDEPPPNENQQETSGLVIANPPGNLPVHLQNTLLLQAYQDLSVKNPEYSKRFVDLLEELSRTQPEDPFVQAGLGHRAFSNNQMAVAASHLKLALSLNNPAILLELAQATVAVGQSEQAIEYLKKGVSLNPYDAVMQKTLILQYINMKSYAEAQTLMQKYVATFPEDKLMRSLLARVSK